MTGGSSHSHSISTHPTHTPIQPGSPWRRHSPSLNTALHKRHLTVSLFFWCPAMTSSHLAKRQNVCSRCTKGLPFQLARADEKPYPTSFSLDRMCAPFFSPTPLVCYSWCSSLEQPLDESFCRPKATPVHPRTALILGEGVPDECSKQTPDR